MEKIKQVDVQKVSGYREALQTLEPRLLFSAVPLITEFLASNNTGLVDEDGDHSDWIEIFNAGDTALNLTGWHLTDDAGDLNQWVFPAMSLEAGEFIVVFASLKDRADADGTELHTNFKLGAGGEYLALVEQDGSTIAHAYDPSFPPQEEDVSYGLAMSTTTQTLVDDSTLLRYLLPSSGTLGTSWTQNGFDDSTWTGNAATTAGIGYENNPGAGTNFTSLLDPDSILPSGTTSAFVRFEFEVADPSAINSLVLGMMYDDGFVAYLNGERVADDFEPAVVAWNSAATDGRGDGVVIEDFVDFNLFDYRNDLVAGTNVLAIHALNTASSSDMLMIPRLTAGIANVVEPYETGFLATPTPGAVNASTFLGFVGDTTFSVDRGFFTTSFSVVITSATAGAQIFYTTDGSAPSPINGTLYGGALNISTTTVLRAIATSPGFVSSNIDTQSYFFLEDVLLQDGAGLPTPPNPSVSTWDYSLDPDIVNDPRYADSLVSDLQSLRTLSLVMDVEDVWGSNGFYANPRNSGIAWERAVSVELIDTDGAGLFQQDAGIRIMGSGSTNRALGKKSMRLAFRDEYGESKLLYPFFGADYTDEINSIAIRGNYFDTWTFQSDSGSLGGACCGRSRSSYIRDQFAHLTQEDMDAKAIAGNWVNLYINGQYWGIYNPTERPDDEFMQSYFGGNDTDYDVVKTGVELVDGTLDGWNTMMNIALGNGANGSLANSAAYNELKQFLDMEAFADYLLMNFWGGNHDWPHNNWYAVRDRVDNGQFTFISWDAENFLFSVNSNRTGVSSSNSPGIIYDRLRQNAEFTLLFADRVQEHFFNGGALSTEATTQRFQEIVDTIRPALNAEAARWGDELTPNAPYNVIDHYDPFVNEKLTNYFPVRTGIVLSQLRSAGLYPSTSFDAPSFSQQGGLLSAGQSLSITNNEAAGTLYYTLDGSDPRLAGGAISGSAIAYSGAFQLPDHATVSARLLRSGTWSAKIQADFVIADTVAAASNLRVTEVHYNPAVPSAGELTAGFIDGDQFEFIEYINTSSETISLDGVELKRTVVGNKLDGITFEFGLLALAPGERIVVVNDLAAFTHRYGSSVNVAGEYAGKLSNAGEVLRIIDAQGTQIQQFKFDDNATTNWPTTPDGDGPSLVVLDTDGDYDDGNNWSASTTTHGTPGSAEAFGLTGDVNGDGFVDGLDLDQVFQNFGALAASSQAADEADLNNDGTVGIADLSLVLNNFGNGTPPAATPTSDTNDEPGSTSGSSDPAPGYSVGEDNADDAADEPDDAPTDDAGNDAPQRPTRPARLVQPIQPTRPTRQAPPTRDTAPASTPALTRDQQRAVAITQRRPDALALVKPITDASTNRTEIVPRETAQARRFDALKLR